MRHTSRKTIVNAKQCTLLNQHIKPTHCRRYRGVNATPRIGTIKQHVLAVALTIVCALCFSSISAAASNGFQQTRTYHLDLPEQTVATALNSLSEQTDIQVLFPYDIAAQLRSEPLLGRFSIELALERLLRDTGLHGGLTSSGVITISQTGSESTTNQNGKGKRMNTNKRKTLLATLVALFVSGAAVHANAQNNFNEPASEQNVLEEVIVTAQKRETNLQDTPLAIQAMSGKELGSKGINDIGDLQNFVPGLKFGKSTLGAKINIRGVGFENTNLGGDPGVAFHVNGAYLARSEAAMAGLFDVSRVEVLLGPQGTLYGRNATGGAINIIQNEPAEELEGYLSTTVGNYDAIIMEGAVGGALVADSLMGRLSIKTANHDGYTENQFPGNGDLDEEDNIAVRAQLLYQAADDLEFLLSADHYSSDTSGTALQVLGSPSNRPTPQEIDGALLSRYGSREVYIDSPTYEKGESDSATLRINWSLPGVDVTSITDYREATYDIFYDEDGSNIAIREDTLIFTDADQFSQELRFNSVKDSAINWVSGLYYFQETAIQHILVDVGPFSTDAAASVGLPADLELLVDLGGELETTSFAVFGQLDYELNQNLGLTAGLRYSIDERKVSNEYNNFVDGSSISNPSPSRPADEFEDVTARLGLQYRISDDVMAYASISNGFKSGSYNIGTISPAFEPETVLAYEGGLKSTFWNNRALLNISGFYYDYTDLQLQQIIGFVSTLKNAGSATAKGLEISGKLILRESIELNYTVAYLDAEFDEFINTNEAFPELGVQDLAGNSLPNAPDLTATVGLDYVKEILSSARLRVGLNYYWQDKMYFDSFNQDAVSQDAVGRIDFALGVESLDEKWIAEAFVKNATDETVYDSMFVVSGVLGAARKANFSTPRLYGMRLRYSF